MLFRPIVITLLATGAQAAAYAPIWWGAGAKNYVTLASKSSVAPQVLTIGNAPDSTSANVIPHFIAKADKTIAWEGRGWCVEANGAENGDVVRVNQCTGAASQRWNWLPQSYGRTMIQLEGTQKCMDLDRKNALNGAQIVLQDCDHAFTESWQFDAAIPSASSSMRNVMISLSALALLGVVSISTWQWKYQQKGRSVTLRQDGMVTSSGESGGLSLTVPASVVQDATDFNAKPDMDAQRMVPAVMAVKDERITKEVQSLARRMKKHMAQVGNVEEAKRIADRMPTVMTDPNFQEQVKKVSAKVNVSGATADLSNTEGSVESFEREEAALAEQMKVVFENPAFLQDSERIAMEMMVRIRNPHFQQEAKKVAEEMKSLNFFEAVDPAIVAIGLATLAALQKIQPGQVSSAACAYALAPIYAASARTASGAPALRVPSVSSRSPAVEMQFGRKKKTTTEILEEKGYWPGEWLCLDCGYIYEPSATVPFEELRKGWKCPQCAGPRRRFVKKAGDMVGELDDTPLFVGTAVAAAIVAGLVYYGLTV